VAEPDNLVPVLLRELRADMDQRFVQADARFDRLEKRLENVRQAAIGESVLGRYAAAEVEERLEQIEKRLAALEMRR
jgi:tetrahydromethanopterin S-methyltransferase subunit G